MDRAKRIVAWASRNERHLGAVLFVFGFLTDLATFSLLSVSLVNAAFIGYLAIAAIATLGSHLFSGAREHPTFWRRALSIGFPLLAQYAIGSLLSGCLIFYTKSAAVIVSWPFLLILALVFIGNEWFRTYYKHLAFQVVLLFFAIYAYAIFAFPLYLHKLGAWVFIGSTAASIVLLAAFLALLRYVNRAGFMGSLRYVLPGTFLIVTAMIACYFTGLIPPIPLTLPAAGIYYSVQHQSGAYILSAPAAGKAWFDPRPEVVPHAAGTPLYAFTSVSAPFDFGTYIVHVWERYDPATKKWQERNRVAFLINGGRDGGYRGYSLMGNPATGKWRVTIETTGHQVIGRIYFNVMNASETPATKMETK